MASHEILGGLVQVYKRGGKAWHCSASLTQERGYTSPYWMTYKQAQEMGAQVREGEKSALVVYAGAIERTDTDEDGEEIEKRIPFMRGYAMFCADQIDGLADHYYRPAPKQIEEKDRLPQADAFLCQPRRRYPRGWEFRVLQHEGGLHSASAIQSFRVGRGPCGDPRARMHPLDAPFVPS
jgi:hypothetical protein